MHGISYRSGSVTNSSRVILMVSYHSEYEDLKRSAMSYCGWYKVPTVQCVCAGHAEPILLSLMNSIAQIPYSAVTKVVDSCVNPHTMCGKFGPSIM